MSSAESGSGGSPMLTRAQRAFLVGFGGANLAPGALCLPKAQSPAGFKSTLSVLFYSWEGLRETDSLEEWRAEGTVRIC